MQHAHTTMITATLAPAAACASVALDIGAGRGALVIYPSERFRGREIEISRLGRPRTPRPHRVSTNGRHPAGSVLTAIFGSLPAGEYVVWEDATHTAGARRVAIGATARGVPRRLSGRDDRETLTAM